MTQSKYRHTIWVRLVNTIILAVVLSSAILIPIRNVMAVEIDSKTNIFTPLKTAYDTAKGANPPAGVKFSTIVNEIIVIILFIVGIAAIIYLLLSGLKYITAGGDEEKATAARKGIINAIIGIIIVVGAWFIFKAATNVGTGVGGGETGTTFTDRL